MDKGGTAVLGAAVDSTYPGLTSSATRSKAPWVKCSRL